jgi:hypothetical protein
MIDDSLRLSLLDKRLTALERELRELKQGHVPPDTPAVPARLSLRCNSPGLLASRAYEVEHFENGNSACWLGADGPVQIKLPVAPRKPYRCELTVAPFKPMSFNHLHLRVNDTPVEHSIEPLTGKQQKISFCGEARNLPFINIVLLGIVSIRPVDLGESKDIRLLAFQLYGVDIEFDPSAGSEG